MGIKVRVQGNEKLEKTLRRFKKRCEKEDLFTELRQNLYFEKPCEKRRRWKRKLEKEIKRKNQEETWERQHSVL